jgi:hypothetical protein
VSRAPGRQDARPSGDRAGASARLAETPRLGDVVHLRYRRSPRAGVRNVRQVLRRISRAATPVEAPRCARCIDFSAR